MITQNILKEMLRYEPSTGKFIWLVDRYSKKCAGKVAGWKVNNGYIRIRVGGCGYQAHRLAYLYMTGKFPKNEIDHVNGDKADNRWNNLRSATREQNACNKKRPATNTSGYKGVSWSRNKWYAQIQINKKKINLGRFKTADAAHLAYVNAAKELHKEFYKAN